MRRYITWIGVLGLGILLGRLPIHAQPVAPSEEALYLREVTERRQTLVESARERYERYPDNFLAASRLALLLSTLRDDQQRGEREFAMRAVEPVYEPELRALIHQCRRLARTEMERAMVQGLTIRTARQALRADASGSFLPEAIRSK